VTESEPDRVDGPETPQGWSPGVVWGLGLVLVAVTVGVCALHMVRTQRRLTTRHLGAPRHRVDFEVFHTNAGVAAGGGDIYTTHQRKRIYPYLYPPLLVSLLRPLAGLELHWAVLLWNLLQLLLIPLGFELLRRLLRSLGAPAPPLLAGVAVVLCTWFFVDNIEWAQVNLLVWLCMLGALLTLRRDQPLASGGLVALAFALKLMPILLVLLVPAMSLRKAGRWLGGFAVGLLVCFLLVPGLVNGFGWTWHMTGAFGELLQGTALGTTQSLPWGNNCANHSLLFALQHGFGLCAPQHTRAAPELIAGLYLALRLVVGVGTLATSVLLRWRGDRVAWSLAVAQLVLAMVLLNPITWIHHWVFLSVALGGLAAAAFEPSLGRRSRGVAAGLGLGLAALCVAAPQLEAFRTGTVSLAQFGLWAGITGLLAVLQISAIGSVQGVEAPGSTAGS
jgi:Glycosyltransferase family 87